MLRRAQAALERDFVLRAPADAGAAAGGGGGGGAAPRTHVMYFDASSTAMYFCAPLRDISGYADAAAVVGAFEAALARPSEEYVEVTRLAWLSAAELLERLPSFLAPVIRALHGELSGGCGCAECALPAAPTASRGGATGGGRRGK